MKHSMLIAALLVTAGLTACEKPTTTVVNVPPPVEGVPGPAGPQGATGTPGQTGAPGGDTTVIVTPPAASAPAN